MLNLKYLTTDAESPLLLNLKSLTTAVLTPITKTIWKALFHGQSDSVIIQQYFREAKLHSIIVKNMCILLRRDSWIMLIKKQSKFSYRHLVGQSWWQKWWNTPLFYFCIDIVFKDTDILNTHLHRLFKIISIINFNYRLILVSKKWWFMCPIDRRFVS